MSDFPDGIDLSLKLSGARLHSLNDTLPEGAGPFIVRKEKDQYVYDIDGNKYVDFSMNEGSVICGHNNKSVSSYIKNAISSGISADFINKLYYPLLKLIKTFVPRGRIYFYDSAKTALISLFSDLKPASAGVSSRYLAGLVSAAGGTKVEIAVKERQYDILLFEPIDFDGDLSEFKYHEYKAKLKCSVESRTAFRIKRAFMTDLGEADVILCSGVIANGLDTAIIVSERHFESEILPLYKTAAVMETLKLYLAAPGFHTMKWNYNSPAIRHSRGSIFKTIRNYNNIDLLKHGIILKNGTGFCCRLHTGHDMKRLLDALAALN